MPDKEIMLQIKTLSDQLGWRALAALPREGVEPDSADAGPRFAEALGQLSGDYRMLADLYEKAKLKGAKTVYIEPLRHAAGQLDKVVATLAQPRPVAPGELRPTSAPPADAGLDEPRHRFEVSPGATGSTCTAMVERNGGINPCGRYPSHPAHRLDGPTERPGLDALIAEATGRVLDSPPATITIEVNGRETDITDQVIVENLPGKVSWATTSLITEATGRVLDPIVLSEQVLPQAELDRFAQQATGIQNGSGVIIVGGLLERGLPLAAADFPGQASGEEVTAYLRGEIDDIPGVPPHAQVGAHDMTKALNPVFVGEQGPEFVDSSRLTNLKPFTTTTAREILNTMPTTSGVPPVPLLGQPGDIGSGYSPAYVPPGGVPLSFAELLTPVPVASLPPHLSHSQIETIGDCPTKYRAQRIGRQEDRDGGADWPETLHEIPQWALIGGNAFHAAVEAFERFMGSGVITPGLFVNRDPISVGSDAVPGPWDMDCDSTWGHFFEAEIQKIEASSPVPRARWRASKKGAEGETWWSVNGPEMLRRYLAARPDEPTAVLPASPPDPMGALEDAIEIERTVDVPTNYGPVPYKVIIDRVTVRQTFEVGPNSRLETILVVRDYKTGDRMPGDTSQLGEYAQVLRLLGVPPQVKIVGTFFDARRGTWTPEVDLDAAWPADWFVYHVTTGQAQRLALTQGPTPARPSSFCGGCAVRWACPIKGVQR